MCSEQLIDKKNGEGSLVEEKIWCKLIPTNEWPIQIDRKVVAIAVASLVGHAATYETYCVRVALQVQGGHVHGQIRIKVISSDMSRVLLSVCWQDYGASAHSFFLFYCALELKTEVKLYQDPRLLLLELHFDAKETSQLKNLHASKKMYAKQFLQTTVSMFFST